MFVKHYNSHDIPKLCFWHLIGCPAFVPVICLTIPSWQLFKNYKSNNNWNFSKKITSFSFIARLLSSLVYCYYPQLEKLKIFLLFIFLRLYESFQQSLIHISQSPQSCFFLLLSAVESETECDTSGSSSQNSSTKQKLEIGKLKLSCGGFKNPSLLIDPV